MSIKHQGDDQKIRQFIVPVGKVAFEGDLFNTKGFATKLTNLFKALPDGGAIAIDSPWGAGKTWFARNWQKDLEENHGYTTIYIDTFAMDYVEDPFLMLAGEILSAAKRLQPSAGDGLLSTGARLGKALLPIGGKILTGVTTKWLIGEAAADGIEKTLEDASTGISDLIERQIENKLKAYEDEKKSALQFREKIRELTSKSTNPIVVFIDELDRCRPDFAIKTLERIKHFFEVEGMIFVLLINGQQLAASVRGIYGQDVDADAYLRKFILFSTALPKSREERYSSPDIRYCKRTLASFGFPETEHHEVFASHFGSLALSLRLEYRDIERGCALYAICQPVAEEGPLLAWIIAVKLWQPELFRRLRNGDKSAHAKIAESRQSFGNSWIVDRAIKLHEAASTDFATPLDNHLRNELSSMVSRSDKDIFPYLIERINLSIQ